jgi:hypothetical protein
MLMDRRDLQQTLGRLLGPAEAEVDCDTCFDQLDRYVELEVEGADADAAIPGLRAHLAGCPACAEEHEGLRALVAADRTD